MDTPPVIPDLSLLRRIGGGSYGEVWLARTITGVYRAVKIVDKARFADERPFLRELDGISRFQRSVGDQPRQLALMHVGRLEERGIFYYTMELADDVEAGTDIDPDKYQPLTLKTLYDRRPNLPAAEVVRIGVELARSLEGLHAAGLIHRDVKPSNIIFVAGVPKLADIGLVSSSDHTLTSLGTPGYSPPEGAGTTRADIYSLGKILYQLATGQHPDEFPRLPRDVAAREDARALFELNEIVLKACQPDPNQRYASAQAMLDDLLLLQAGRSVKELNAMRERLRLLGRVALWCGAAALVVIGVLGVRNYFAVRELAAAEQRARIRAEDDERLARYTADLGLAQMAITQQDIGIARSALRRQIPAEGGPDLRGPEWRLMWNDTLGDAAEVFGAPVRTTIQDLSLSPKGNLLAIREGGTSSGALVLLDLLTGARRVVGDGFRAIGGFSPDGVRLLAGGSAQNIRVISSATGQIESEQATQGRLLSGTDDGRHVLLYHAQAFGYRVELWDTVEGRSVTILESLPSPDNWRPQAFAVSNESRLLAAAVNVTRGMTRERELVMRDLDTREVRWRVSDPALAQAMAFSPDSRWLAVGGARAPIRLYDAMTGERVAEMPGHLRSILSLAFSPDSRQLASGGGDHTVRLWRVPEGEPVAVLRGHEADVSRVAWAPDGRSVVSGSFDGTVRRWALPTASRSTVIPDLWAQIEGGFCFLPGSRHIAATDRFGTLSLFDDRTLALVARVEQVFQPLVPTHDGAAVIAIGVNRELVRYDALAGIVTPTGLRVAGEERLLEPAASPDGTRVAVAGFDGRITIFDLNRNVSVVAAEVHGNQVTAMAFSPDGLSVLSVDGDGNARVWDAASGNVRQRWSLLRTAVLSAVFTPHGERVIVGDDQGRIHVIDRATGEVESTFSGHSGSVNSLCWTPDGRRLLSGGDDGFLNFWSAGDYRLLATVPVLTPSVAPTDQGVFMVRVAPDGTRLGALTQDGRLRIWSLEQVSP